MSNAFIKSKLIGKRGEKKITNIAREILNRTEKEERTVIEEMIYLI